MSRQSEKDRFLSGTSQQAYTYFGPHRTQEGYRFRVWAPNARSVSLVGRWNRWDDRAEPMQNTGDGIWELECRACREFDEYKYAIGLPGGGIRLKADPFAQHMCTRPATASRVYDHPDYPWTDQAWQKARTDPLRQPVNIYEVHLGSWDRYPDGNPYSYSAMGDKLIPYALDMGYTYLEFLPLAEHPYDPSWGYQVTGFFAPTSRFGTPDDLKGLIDRCHNAGLGVILDWVGAHFPKDAHGLMEFDGTCLYESADPLQQEHRDWDTRAFDFARPQVRSFLVSSVVYWMKEYHLDGLRVDAVSSMLYLDYGRRPGQWRPGPDGSNINQSAVSLLQAVNRAAFQVNPNALMIAEESTAFPLVTKPDYVGGLGFNFKWNMGWMHDMLDYMQTHPYDRGCKHRHLTFAMTYAFSENFVLALSHDEVVHGKRSLLERMPGGYEEKFVNLSLLYAYMVAHPGKKLLFMGGEFGQFIEWDARRPLDWFLLDYEAHARLRTFVRALNRLYRARPALWERDTGWDGFRWLVPDDDRQSVVAFVRYGGDDSLVFVCNFGLRSIPVYRLGVPEPGTYTLVLSSVDKAFGGQGGLLTSVRSESVPMHGCEHSVELALPSLCAAFYQRKTDSLRRYRMAAKKQCVAMLLAGGQGSRLQALTRATAKPALPFGGKYRIIDFPLSNCVNSGVDTVGVLTQYQPLELHAYLANGQSWDLNRSFGGVQILPPYTACGRAEWYLGTADAIYQNLAFLERYDPEFVLILSADHVYSMDYGRMLRFHRQVSADCTIAVREVSLQEASRMGVVELGQEGRITGFEEKPREPKGQMVSMGVYLFRWELLKICLAEDHIRSDSSHDFGRDLIPRLLEEGRGLYAFPFSGYWRDVGTLESLWQTNMDFLAQNGVLREEFSHIRTKNTPLPPCLVRSGGSLPGSIAADGCVIAGTVRHSVLSENCLVEPGAEVEDCVLLPGAVIGSGAVVRRAILGERCQVGANARIGGTQQDAPLCVIGSDAVIAYGRIIKTTEEAEADL